MAIAADGGRGVVRRRGETRQGGVHHGIHQVVVIVLDAADVGDRRQRIADDGLQAFIGGAQLHAAHAPQGEQ